MSTEEPKEEVVYPSAAADAPGPFGYLLTQSSISMLAQSDALQGS